MKCLGCGTEFQRDLLLKKHLLATQACLEAMGGSIEAARKMIKSHKGKVRYGENPDPARERSRSRYASDPEKSREERNARYEENPEPDKERSRVRYEEQGEEIREKRRERYEENPEPDKERSRVRYEEQGEEIREHTNARYEGNPEPVKERSRVRYEEQGEEIREKRKERYKGNPEQEKEQKRVYYEEHVQERRDAIYAQRAATDSMEVLLNFRTKCRYGPSFPCIVCHELKFRGQVSAIKLEDIEDEFVTGNFIRRQSKLFLKHGSFHICTPCKSKVSWGELPKLAARNSLNCPWDNVPKQFLTLNAVENSILAPNLLLANVHNVIPEASDSKRLVAVPVSTDEVGNRVSSVTDTSGTLNSMVQSNQINRPHEPSHVRGRLVKLAFAYLAGQQQNPYTVRDDENSANKIIQLEAFADERSLPDPVPLYDSDTELEVADLSADPVERNRNCLPQVKTVFIPDGNVLPGSFGCPVNFLDVRHPYVTTMPMFFPEGRFGLHDPDRVLPISEGEFVLHHMRNVRKELLYSPLFISTAIYRLEIHRLISACHALRDIR